ncbi:DUF6616 family protein [Burkholderia ambifaria]|uniref:DUF6616 family protein n=1 Tax=Burkholderia ambifaria TaxID=152480 RepID=UPI00158B7196|nr:DUF6616 family protein [Burkholderia ambifaria]
MEHIFIELWKFKDSWKNAGVDVRTQYVENLLPSMQALLSAGIVIVAWGYNDPGVDRRADYDAFGVYRMPNRALFDEFQKAVAGSGWYDYFEHVNAGGTLVAPPDMLSQHIQLVMPGTAPGAGN